MSQPNNMPVLAGQPVIKKTKGPPEPVRFASFLGDNAFEFYRQVVAYLGQATGLPTEMVCELSADKQDQKVNAGQIQAVFTCGLPYVRKADRQPPLLRLLAAPVMDEARYQNRPIYFSDIIVRADSPYRSLADLRGATFTYNEVYSLSGYMLPCYHLFTRGEIGSFFKETVQSGSHAASMDWVEAGHAATAAIDSVVLAMEMAQRPERASGLRVVERVGPMPMPPVAASTQLAHPLHHQLQQALLTMHTTGRGQAVLKQGGLRRFASVTDSDYDPIRRVIQVLDNAGVTELR